MLDGLRRGEVVMRGEDSVERRTFMSSTRSSSRNCSWEIARHTCSLYPRWPHTGAKRQGEVGEEARVPWTTTSVPGLESPPPRLCSVKVRREGHCIASEKASRMSSYGAHAASHLGEAAHVVHLANLVGLRPRLREWLTTAPPTNLQHKRCQRSTRLQPLCAHKQVG